ncbi:MAG TPA: hypothetical protein VJ046_03755, partial [Candidatus Paceibacterota bacterium]|nr:hypothetical protein [Candidatus Paceibacterota bacterium]
VERSHWMDQLAYLLRVKEDAVEADIMSAPDLDVPVPTLPAVETKKPVPAAQREGNFGSGTLNEALLSLVVRKPALFKQEIAVLDRNFLNPLASQVLDELAKEDLEQFNFGSFTKKFDSDRTLDLEFVYLRSQALWEGFGDEELKTEFSNIFNKLKQKTIHLHLAELGYEMRAAEAAKDKDKINVLVAKFNELAQSLAEIHNS